MEVKRINKTRIVTMVLLCALFVTGALAVSGNAYAKNKVTKAYDKKIKELKKEKKYKKGISDVRIKCGKGEKILVVTPSDSIYADGATIEATIYQYVDGEVKLIDSVQSTGTAYPIMYTKKAILFGGNHSAGKLTIKNGKAVLDELTNTNMEKGKAVYKTYSVEDGKRTETSCKKISQKKAGKMNFFSKGGEVIGFE